MEADHDGDGKLSFEEFTQMVSNTVRAVALSAKTTLTERKHTGYRQADDIGRPLLVPYHTRAQSLTLLLPSFRFQGTNIQNVLPCCDSISTFSVNIDEAQCIISRRSPGF